MKKQYFLKGQYPTQPEDNFNFVCSRLDLMSFTQEDIQVVPARVAASLRALTNLTALTCLCVQGHDLPEGSCISPAVIRAWSHWTNLQELQLGLRYQKLEDLLMLSQLRSLRVLSIDGSDDGRNDSLEIQVGRPCKRASWLFLLSACKMLSGLAIQRPDAPGLAFEISHRIICFLPVVKGCFCFPLSL